MATRGREKHIKTDIDLASMAKDQIEHDTTFPEMLSSKRDDLRLAWLDTALDRLSKYKSTASTPDAEILSYILDQSRNYEFIAKAVQLSVNLRLCSTIGSYDWDENVQQISDMAYNQLEKRFDGSNLLNGLVRKTGLSVLKDLVILIMVNGETERAVTKEIEAIILHLIVPFIHSCGDEVDKVESGYLDGFEEHGSDEEGAIEMTNSEILIECLGFWTAFASFISSKSLKHHLEDITPSLITLLRHPKDIVRLEAAKALVGVVDMATREGCIFGTDLSGNEFKLTELYHDALNEMNRVSYDRDLDWQTDKGMDIIRDFRGVASFMEEKTDLVLVECILIPAITSHQALNENHYFLHAVKDKKGHPVAGYVDAATISLIKDHLGSAFDVLYRGDKLNRSDFGSKDFRDLIGMLIARHPRAQNASDFISELRVWGPGRYSSTYKDSYGRKSKKVNVADYM